jgi:hypothetical protein
MTTLSFEVDPSTLTSIPILTVYGGSEFLDHTPPDVRWVVPGLLPLGIPTVLASQPGLGKSYLMLQLCVALAAGKPFLDFDPQHPCAACYFGLEDGKDMFHRRVRSIIDHYRFCQDWTLENESNFRRNFTAPFINWKSEGATSFLPDLMPNLELLLTTYAERGVSPGVIIIDTLARVSDGDENTVQGLRPVLNACSRLAEYGHTPIVLHHVGKGQDGARNAKDKPTLADRMSTDWIRGTGSIVGNFRCTMQFAKISEDEASGAGLDPDMARNGQLLVFGTTKFNNGPKGEWKVIVQDDGGRWSVLPDSIEVLARLRGSKAVAALSKQFEVLKDIYAARFASELDRRALERKHWPDAIPLKAANSLKQVMNKLRLAGYLEKKSNSITALGLSKIQVTERVTGWSADDE